MRPSKKSSGRPDDLGYHDLGIRNGGLTITPAIDALIEGGVTCVPGALASRVLLPAMRLLVA